MCSYFIVGNKIFCFFKNVRVYFKGEGSKVFQNFEGVAHKWGVLTDLDFFFGGGGLCKKG